MASTMAVPATRRIYAGLRVEPTNGQCGRTSAAADSPAAKRINGAKDNNVWVAVDEGGMSGTVAGDSRRPVLFHTMKVKGSILHPYRSGHPGT